MPYRNLGNKAHTYIHLSSICGIAIGLPLNKVVLSISLMIGILNLLIEANYKTYWNNLKASKTTWFIGSFWLLHVVGLLWTSEMNFGLSDIRIKLPLIVIPLILTCKPITERKEINYIFLSFISSLIFTSFYNYFSYIGIIHDYKYNDIRGLSLFGSHIRYGILIAIGAILSLYLLITQQKIKWLYAMLFTWFAFYTFYSQIISGALAFGIGIIAYLLFYIYQYKRQVFIISSLVLVLLPILTLVYINQAKETKPAKLDLTKLDQTTKKGNAYVHSSLGSQHPNGQYIFVNLCELELREEWNKVSTFDYDGKDKKGQILRYTLMRYMTSMGLKKDAHDFKQLQKSDILNIENGNADINDTKSGILARISGIRFQIQNNIDPNGHSLLQRIEYWKTGWQIVKTNWVIGVGTGDTQVAFDKQYDRDNSPLGKENRLRAHNTYLTVWISFGIIGIGLFGWLITFYLKTSLQLNHPLAFVFILIACSTFLIEDTLETQTGVTLFAFFYALLSVKINPYRS
jgi:hypothetical protein